MHPVIHSPYPYVRAIIQPTHLARLPLFPAKRSNRSTTIVQFSNNNNIENGNGNGHYRPEQTNGLSPAEMTVADLSVVVDLNDSATLTTSFDEPLRKVSVPPRPKTMPPQAQRTVDQVYWSRANNTSATATIAATALIPMQDDPAQIELTAKVQQQALELQQARAELAEKNAEIETLRSQAVEREARLRAARADLMESQALSVEKEAKLTELYRVMADASAERARLRDELAHTKMELAETMTELESLADEILKMSGMDAEYVDEEEQGAGVGVGNTTTISRTEQNDQAGVGRFSSPQGTAPLHIPPAWDILQNLAEMSKQLLEDAKIDEEAFFGAGFFSSSSNSGKSTFERLLGGGSGKDRKE